MASDDLDCDLCKVTYTTSQELEEHNWSLMHHIKIEKTQKGSSHSCNLCGTSCENIIEYGKHLNEDKHKLALSRRTGGNQEELLDSFSNQSELQEKDTTAAEMEIGYGGHSLLCDFPGQYHSNKHSRSFSQPELYKPQPWENYPMYQEDFRIVRQSGSGGQNPRFFPQGPVEHMIPPPHMRGKWNHMNASFFQDDSMNWNGSQFQVWNNDGYMNQMNYGPMGQGSPRGGRRRGSFDDSFDRSFNNAGQRRPDSRGGGGRNDNRQMADNDSMLDRRGRGWQRGARGRNNSYDNINRQINRYESRSADRLQNRSLDSYDDRNPNQYGRNDLKRRNDEEYNVHPEKSRRGNEDFRMGPPARPISPALHYETNTIQGEVGVTDSTKKVTWSDQQCVSSTTDPEMEGEATKSGSRRKTRVSPRSHSPDSASSKPAEVSSGKKMGKKKMKNSSSNERLNKIDSAEHTKAQKSQKDSTESVLEKAEKLCKKLRNDREMLKKQKAQAEKIKKAEKAEELNSQINKLSHINRENIRGHLDNVETPVCIKPSVKHPVVYPAKITSALERVAASIGITSLPSTPATTPTPTPSTPLNAPTLEDEPTRAFAKTNTVLNKPEPSVSERLAQTRKEIDSIRAKIESSVHGDALTPQSPGQRSHGLSDTISPGLKGSPFCSNKKTDHNALLKMVNSPRSTKERLMLANMLRDHAKSQKKLSLPRFNLKFSDLCTGSDRPEAIADLDLETLAPSVQLEIANLIEADIKPDVAELERLLESASSANAELDLNVLSELGLLVAPKVGDISGGRAPSPSCRGSSPLTHLQAAEKLISSGKTSPLVRTPSPAPSPSRLDQGRLTLDDLGSGRHLSLEDLNRNGKKLHSATPNPASHEQSLSNTQSNLTGSLGIRKSPEKSLSSSLPVSVQNISTTSEQSNIDESNFFSLSKVKKEKVDGGYEKSALGQQPRASARFDPYRYEGKSRDENEDDLPCRTTITTLDGKVLPIRRSKHTEKLFSKMDDFELPTRDTDRTALATRDRTLSGSPIQEAYKIPALIPGTEGGSVISPHKEWEPPTSPQQGSSYSYRDMELTHAPKLTSDKKASRSPPGSGDRTLSDKRPSNVEKSSLSTNEASDSRSALEKVTAILGGVPSMDTVLKRHVSSRPVSPRPVSPRTASPGPAVGQGLTHIPEKNKDLNVSQSSQTSSVLEQVYNISLQEETVRSDILSLDQKIGQLETLIEEAKKQLFTFTHRKNELMNQEKEFRNTRMKLLAESRSLLSSTSSQGSGDRQACSDLRQQLIETQLQSNPVMVRYMMSQDNPAELSSIGGFSNVESGSQSEMEVTSQRRASIGSATSDIFRPSSRKDKDSGTAISGEGADKYKKKAEGESSSYSLLNKPFDKTGFITLEALMKGDSDIGKLLHKSLESIEQGKFLQDSSPLEKQSSSESQTKENTGAVRSRDRSFSIGSDELLQSGSDGERRSGRVSMKYMGELPDGVSYDTFVKQMTKDNKNKPLLFTVLSSPVSQVRSGTDSGVGTGSVSSHMTPTSVLGNSKSVPEEGGYKSDQSFKTTSTHTLTGDLDTQSMKSGYSLGEQIKRICDSQGNSADHNQTMDLLTPRSDSSGEKTLEDESSKVTALDVSKRFECPPPRKQHYKSDGTQADELLRGLNENEKRKFSVSPEASKIIIPDSPSGSTLQNTRNTQYDVGSPTRKRLKSKKERDQRSRRKQKESFILLSDTNSEGDNETSFSSQNKTKAGQTTVSEEDLVITGSEDCRTPRVVESQRAGAALRTGAEKQESHIVDLTQLGSSPLAPETSGHREASEMKRSLLDEVQLETETQSDEERFSRAERRSRTSREPVKYKGPPLSVACMQVFKGDLYICYNGTEIRRFNLKTGEILKELDCSPYLVHTMTLCDVKDRQDILYTAGSYHKLMLFEPQKFTLLGTFDYTERILCIHDNWDKLFLGLSDGSVAVRSLKTDKELNIFSCATKGVQCLASTSAGMTKMLCLGTSDHVIYVLDASTGLLITMLEGHTQAPLCIQIFGEKVLSAAADKALIAHSAMSGEMLKSVRCDKPVARMWTDQTYVYTACRDEVIRCYNINLKMTKVLNPGCTEMITCGIVHDGTVITGFRNGMAQTVIA